MALAQVLVGLEAQTRPLVEAALAGLGEPVYFRELPPAERRAALASVPVLLTFHPHREIAPEDWPEAPAWRLVQLLTAGADHLDFRRFPAHCTICCNAGGFAEPMAEHVLAMALALCKKLLPNHRALQAGEFNQFAETGTLRGKVCGILGYGGIGRATAALMRRMDMRIHALNRRGAGDDALVDEAYGAHALEPFLRGIDVLVICLPLTRHTRGLLGARELGWLKPDAMIINVARGEVVDEAALYAFLRSHPQAGAGIDAWWVEPFRHGQFRMDLPFLELPNVLGSPHNSARAPGWERIALERACANLVRALRGEPVRGRLAWGPDGVE